MSWFGNFLFDTAWQLVTDKLMHTKERINRHYNKKTYQTQNINNESYTIPIVLGNVKVTGRIIWLSSIREVVNIEEQKKQISKHHSHYYTDYHYNYLQDAVVAICQGPVQELLNIQLDDEPINCQHRIYLGCNQQMPDALLKRHLGEFAPAFRDLCYIVLENVKIDDYGGRIPEVSCEVVNYQPITNNRIEDKIFGINLIPGSGEFVYATTKVQKHQIYIHNEANILHGAPDVLNYHTAYNKSNLEVSLQQLKYSCPNVKWISTVVNWFVSSPFLGEALLRPGVEYQDNLSITTGLTWQVASYQREDAYLIKHFSTKDINYGGTPSDNSVLEMLAAITDYKIMFYPMILVDDHKKTWRGHLEGSSHEAADFIKKEYRDFILHYASLTMGKISGFIIGSELVGITKHPEALIELIALAEEVKKIVGTEVIVTYAADWSEYHHDANGYYHLDDLWSNNAIDIIGIDAYFPLGNYQEQIYDAVVLEQEFYQGEGFDFYWDAEGVAQPLSVAYAWKNIRWWWENEHINPDGQKTSFIPKSKPIWFIEFGFASLDLSTNQPNIFLSKNAKTLPRFSNGEVDYLAQRIAIEAVLNFVEHNQDMIHMALLWAWDARPFPIWPNNQEFWSDGQDHATGHWVNGKLGQLQLQDVLAYILKAIGMSHDDFQVDNLCVPITGFLLENGNAKHHLGILQQMYNFNCSMRNGKLSFYQDIFNNHIVDRKLLSQSPHIEETEVECAAIAIHHLGEKTGVTRHYLQEYGSHFTLHCPVILSNNEANQVAKLMYINMVNTSYTVEFTMLLYDYFVTPIQIGEVIEYENQWYKIVFAQIKAFEVLYSANLIAKNYMLLQEQYHALSHNTMHSELIMFVYNLPIQGNNLFIAISDIFANSPIVSVQITEYHNNSIKEESYSIAANATIWALLTPLTKHYPYLNDIDTIEILWQYGSPPPHSGYLLIEEELLYAEVIEKRSERVFCIKGVHHIIRNNSLDIGTQGSILQPSILQLTASTKVEINGKYRDVLLKNVKNITLV